MTEAEEKWLHRYLDGAISPEDSESLENLLRADAETRRTLRTLATIDSKWRQLAADEDVGAAPPQLYSRQYEDLG